MKKLSNKILIESALNDIVKETGYHIIKKYYSDSYFVIAGEKNSICEFEIKEIPNFKFAIWCTNRFDSIKYQLDNNHILWSDSLGVDSKSELIIFSQYKPFIDKFKPSTSNLITGMYRTFYKENNKTISEWYLVDAIEMLIFMKKHRTEAIYYSSIYGNRIWNKENFLRIAYIIYKELFIDYIYNLKKDLKYKYSLNKIIKTLKSLKCFDILLVKQKNIIPDLYLCLRKKHNVDSTLYNTECKLLDRLDSKYFSILDIQYFYLDDLSSKDNRKNDLTLRRNFSKYLKYCKDSNKKILYCNKEDMYEQLNL